MARRRLPPPISPEGPVQLETKAMYPLGVAPTFTRPPVASVAAGSAAEAALREVSDELTRLREEGRMVLRLPLAAIDAGHLLRDRLISDPEEMAALSDSLRSHGQRMPIEVSELAPGRYGLISGWRRLNALRALAEAEPERFGHVLALVRRPETAAESYIAMVEENEIRAGLSYWERARLVLRATEAGVFEDERAALRRLFASASRAKRSKIGSFTRLVRDLEPALRFPADLPERLGLALVQGLEQDSTLKGRIETVLQRKVPADAAAEQAALAATLRGPQVRPDRTDRRSAITPDLWLEAGKDRITLGGKALDAALIRRLETFLRETLTK